MGMIDDVLDETWRYEEEGWKPRELENLEAKHLPLGRELMMMHYVISLLQGHITVKIPSYEKPIKGIMVYTMCMHVIFCERLAWAGNSLSLSAKM